MSSLQDDKCHISPFASSQGGIEAVVVLRIAHHHKGFFIIALLVVALTLGRIRKSFPKKSSYNNGHGGYGKKDKGQLYPYQQESH